MRTLTRLFFFALALTTSSIAYAAPKGGFSPLAENFEKNFQITNTLNLSGRIAFTAHINGYDRILLLDLDSHRVRKAVDGPGNNSYPSWAPNGRRFSFTSDRDGHREIYHANWDGSEPYRVTNSPGDKQDAFWAFDGVAIVFSHRQGTPDNLRTNIFTAYPDGSGLAQITNFKGQNLTPHFSATGAFIAFATNRFWPGWDICFVDMLHKLETCPLKGSESYSRPAFSHNNKFMAYSTGYGNQVDLWQMSLGNDTKEALTTLNGREYDAVYLQNDQLIAFTAEVKPGIFNIMTVDQNKKVEPLLSSPYSLRYLSWSPQKTIELQAEILAAEQRAASAKKQK